MKIKILVYKKIWEEKKMNAKQLTAAETIVMKCIWDADHEMSLAEIVKMQMRDTEKSGNHRRYRLIWQNSA